MYELIVTEKPSAAKKIAYALADKSPDEVKEKGVTYYNVVRAGKRIVVVSAVGHLYTVAEKEKSFKYPSYDIDWFPSSKIDKNSAYTKKYVDVIKKVTKNADSYTVACDFDVEGEVIGLNVVRFICGQKDANRMKFSTLVKKDIEKSYDSKEKTLAWGQALAGETRHFIDWLYGINISRALMTAVKTAGSFKILSSGRVQGPALKILADKESSIQKFKPVPYWQLKMVTSHDKDTLESVHEKDKFWDESVSDASLKKSKSVDKAKVADVDSRSWKQKPPIPFDLGGLQAEAYKLFNFSPKRTLQIAQSLYLKGVTSYPRTSSQQLPPELGFKKILGELQKIPEYSVLAKKVLDFKDLKPNNGKKKDPAHPAIYPTGQKGSVAGDDKKLFDLIVKRFFAVFGPHATKETVKISLDAGGEIFKVKGSTTKDPGWHLLYMPYAKQKEEELPSMSKGDMVPIKEVRKESKQTEPPKRFTQASLISDLEKRNLGTKATRADIVQSLYDRGYVVEKNLQVTELGMKLIEIMDKYSPEIVNEDLARKVEQDTEDVKVQKQKPENVLKTVKETLSKELQKFKDNEKVIGKQFIESHRETQDHLNTLGQCPVCKEGSIKIRKGKYGQFAACDAYPECKTTFSIPKGILVKPTEEVSSTGYPVVEAIKKGKRPQKLSINPRDNVAEDKKSLVDKLENMDYKDPDSGIEMKLRFGFFGPFLAAKNYPKEKKIISLDSIKEENL